ncbi:MULTISPECIES: YggT family protein [Thalassobaculum]|uniref:YggT family protein n=1 Tax=Thalassobaculum litoreum DSM 18839 TaxID=1123362 RepID=A0A8G2EZX0_9PROT|nr:MULTISPECIES: YggT family protein [Thalassobaculum]SDG22508.1 YggT family protein [Thalassobaculum litoreum DSM 18839]
MNSIIWLIGAVVHYLTIALFVYIVIDLLVKFGVLNAYNQVVQVVMNFLSRVFEPMLRPIRSILPDLGGIDISPVILVLLLQFAVRLLNEVARGL